MNVYTIITVIVKSEIIQEIILKEKISLDIIGFKVEYKNIEE